MNTKTLHEIKAEKQSKFDALLTQCGVFFAFSNEQFHENKTPLQEGEKYVSMGAGGYMPKGKVQAYLTGSKEINNWYKKEIKAGKDLRRQNILYELCNHEAFYTGDLEDTLNALGKGYTLAEVRKVFNAEYEKQTVNI